MNDLTRKEFLKTTLAAGATLLTARSFAASTPEGAPAVAAPGSANGDVRIAIIGVRSQGASHMRTHLKMPGARVVALCDPDSKILAQRAEECAKAGAKVATYTDIRKLLDDRNVDAVVIATPNHWHSLATVWACQAGKDVYVEKPLSHNVWEGRQAVAAARKYNRIVQAGTQSRSSQDIREAIALLRSGELGKIQWARGICYKPRNSIGKTSGPQPVPANIDYDLWSGPAPLVWPRRNSRQYGSVHYDWHWFWNYGGGDIANQGIHQMDVARWMLGEAGLPPSVMSVGGRFGYEDDAETPNTQIAVLAYEKAPLIFEVRGLPAKAGMRAMDSYRVTRIGVVVQCESGYIVIGEDGVVVFDNQNKRIKQFSNGGASAHRKNFIDAVRSRKSDMLNAPVEDSHISSSLCHLANISYRLGADRGVAEVKEALKNDAQMGESYARMMSHLEANQVAMDKAAVVVGPSLGIVPGREEFVSKEKFDPGYWANTLLTREYRAPFVVPRIV